jgi:hypothetical protein
MERRQIESSKRMANLKRILLLALGWAIFHGQLQFNILVNESSGIRPVWFLLVFLMALLTSSLLDEAEEAFKTWIISIVFSVVIVLLLITLPIAFGILASEFAPLVIVGSIQPMATVLILTAPINLIGCFLGQITRNKLI